MIKYDRLWATMKKRGISQYALYTFYGVDRSLLNRFRKNMNVEIFTLDRLCAILDCRIEDIVEYVPDTSDERDKKEDDSRQV
ncbi:MAG: helix-turn-helix transcriptional regulator [Eubacteriales bacterium]|nr:helix-turn-helix transcriptional regulator [Eubacteriales bacterium]